MSGLRKFTHRLMLFGYGNSQYAASHGRPVWKIGNIAAHMTAKIVIASAKRLMDMRHFCRNSSRIAEMSVPACPIPIHQTKLTIAKPQPTGMLTPQMPVPLMTSHVMANRNIDITPKAIAKPPTQPGRKPGTSTADVILSVTEPNDWPGPTTSDRRAMPAGAGAACDSIGG